MAAAKKIPDKFDILIVDDNSENLRLLSHILVKEGYAVRPAKSGKLALEAARKKVPDLVLLDVMMPEMDGYEVCRRLKASSTTRAVPVIFLTARKKTPEDLAEGFAVGGADYLTKPFHTSELSARVRTHLALRRAYMELEESEQRYRAVVEDQTELICRFRADGVMIYANPAYERFFGTDRVSIQGKTFYEWIPETEHNRIRAHLATIGPENPVAELEHPVRDAHDETRWLRWTNRALLSEAGELEGFQSVGRDVTDRVHAEAAYRALVDHSLQGMVIFQGKRCVFANPMAGELTGLSPEQLTALSPAELRRLIHPDSRESALGRIACLSAKNKESVRLHVRLSPENGPDRWVDVQVAPVAFRGRPSFQATAVDMTRLRQLESLLAERSGFEMMVGRCPGMQRVYTLIEQLAPTDITVLVTGETGTGKELAAEALHGRSDRAEGPLVRINCAELPENLIESELFGHVRGAFTGADRDRPGRFQLADGGTLFLDEIGDLPLHLQVKLLRVLESREVQRVGDSRGRRVNLRIIAASNRNLEKLVAEGRFREDLFFRLKGARIVLPPLRERGRDILELFEHFKTRFCDGARRGPIRLRADVAPLLLGYAWPGNVRELKNAAEASCSLCPDTVLSPSDLPEEIRNAAPAARATPAPPPAEPADEAQRIRQALEACRWHKGQAAEMLGISRSTLYRKLAEFGMHRNR